MSDQNNVHSLPGELRFTDPDSVDETTCDRQILQQLFVEVRSALRSESMFLHVRLVAERELKLLEWEICRTQTPDAEIIKRSGSSLIDNVPFLAGSMARLFSNPVVRRRVEAAGGVAVEWASYLHSIYTRKGKGQ